MVGWGECKEGKASESSLHHVHVCLVESAQHRKRLLSTEVMEDAGSLKRLSHVLMRGAGGCLGGGGGATTVCALDGFVSVFMKQMGCGTRGLCHPPNPPPPAYGEPKLRDDAANLVKLFVCLKANVGFLSMSGFTGLCYERGDIYHQVLNCLNCLSGVGGVVHRFVCLVYFIFMSVTYDENKNTQPKELSVCSNQTWGAAGASLTL